MAIDDFKNDDEGERAMTPDCRNDQQVRLLSPATRDELRKTNQGLSDASGKLYPKVNGVYRMTGEPNYTFNFGFQWNKFPKTQIDTVSRSTQSRDRFFAETNWKAEELHSKCVLEVGSGAGRFSQVVLDYTLAKLYSVDYSAAVEANFRNNGHHGDRLNLFQASIYELPFAPGSFDKVFCFGVLQHTPDFDASIRALIHQAKPGAEIVVDFYPIRGWWTKINAKYLLRPFVRRMPHDRLLRLIERNVDWLSAVYSFLRRIGLGAFNRFLPICEIAGFPSTLSPAERREWTILDTFDQYSPEHDHPQRIAEVAKMFERHGADVIFAGDVNYGVGMKAAVVRGVRRNT